MSCSSNRNRLLGSCSSTLVSSTKSLAGPWGRALGAGAATGAAAASVGAGLALRVAARTGVGAATAVLLALASATSATLGSWLAVGGRALMVVASSPVGAARRVRFAGLRAVVAMASGVRRLAGLVGAGGRGMGLILRAGQKAKSRPANRAAWVSESGEGEGAQLWHRPHYAVG